MLHAMRTENYEQIFIYEDQSGISTVKLIHMKPDKHEYERLVFLDGHEREFLRKDHKIVEVDGFKKHELANIASYIPFEGENFNIIPEKIKKLYLFKIDKNSRMAGRECAKISIIPKDKDRYGFLLWIDRSTHILLRMDLINENNAVLERFMVVKFKPGNALTDKDVLWVKGAAANKKVNMKIPDQGKLHKAGEKTTIFPWSIDWLPAGYYHYNTNTVLSPVNNEIFANHILYSDGLSSFSVYVEKDTSGKLSHSVQKFGAYTVAVHVFRIDGKAYYCATLVGELPLATAERIVASIHRK